MDDSQSVVNSLVNFLESSPVSYFAIKNIVNELNENGFKLLNEGDKWNLEKGGKYYVTRNQTSLVSFTLGDKPWDTGFKIIGAHTDSPMLKIKELSETNTAGVIKVGVDPYGGAILSTWLDRDLSIAGKVVFSTNNGIDSVFIDFKRPMAIIPNLAIHLNSDVNKGFEYNKQNHLQAIIGVNSNQESGAETLKNMVAKETDIPPKSILSMDLYLYDVQKPAVIGYNRDLISSGRIDNLAMCHSILKAITAHNSSKTTNVGAFFDNEEVGSITPQGADSNFLTSVLNRITYALGGDLEDNYRARNRSFLISADGAHAVHPNFIDKHDSFYSPKINMGPVIKISSNYRYSTNVDSYSYIKDLCLKNNLPFQTIMNRSDIPSGSTIGPMSTAGLGINGVDIGNPMYAMHSIRETQGTLDHWYMTRLLTEFYK